MTTKGTENRFGRFVLDEEQAKRIQAGDMSAVWDFIEQNHKFLTCWARKFIRNRLSSSPEGYYEAEEFVNQIYVDFPFYNLENGDTLALSISRSFRQIAGGGYCTWSNSVSGALSLDAPLKISARSGDKEDGETLGAQLVSHEPIPSEVLEEREHIEEIAPHVYSELGRVFGKRVDEFREAVEAVFWGLLFEEVQAYARVEA